MRAEHREHAAPAEEVADQAGQRCAQQIAGHGAGQRAPDRDLTLVGPTRSLVSPSAIGNTPPEPMPARMRVANSSENEVDSAPRMLASAEQHQAHDHQPRLAEQIGGGAQHRLDDGEGEGEHGGEARGGGNADAEIVGDMRQHRIERARRQAGRKRRKRNDVERRRQAAGCGHGAIRGLKARLSRLGERVELHQRSQQGLRTRAAAPCWDRPTAHDRDRDGSR